VLIAFQIVNEPVPIGGGSPLEEAITNTNSLVLAQAQESLWRLHSTCRSRNHRWPQRRAGDSFFGKGLVNRPSKVGLSTA
jgi:hypothetical protein